jgi:hypothetical protein
VNKPYKNKPCCDISEVSNLSIPVLWSYHPKYLQMIGAVEKTVDMIVDVLKK